MTLLEVMVAVLVLSVAVYILTSTVMASVHHSIAKGQRTLAVQGAMNAIERIRALPQQDVFAEYNTVTTDDPYGAGTGRGRYFDVEGLDGVRNAQGEVQPVGQILLPGRGAMLIESMNQPEFGLPRDLDGNMSIDSEDCCDSYIVLPIIVRMEWQSRTGTRSFEMATMLADLAKWTP